MLIDTEKITLQIPSTPENFKLLYPFIEQICSVWSINSDCAANIELVVGEAVNNAITHGNKGNANKLVSISAENNDDVLSIFIKDDGDGFNFNNIPDPTLPENIECPTGRGVFLMKQLADLVVFSNNGNTTEVQFKL
jgi:serine/threonine-protein kinase RsbW